MRYPLLADVLGGYFHQDAYVSSSPGKPDRVLSDSEVIEEVRSMHDQQERVKLAEEIGALLTKDDRVLITFWNAHAGCHIYTAEMGADARALFSAFHRHLVAGDA